MSDLNKLAQHREALLLAATGALLHNLGKVSKQFLENKLEIGSPSFLYQHILCLIAPLCPSLPAALWDNKCSKLPDSDILDTATKQALSDNPFMLPFPFNDRVYVPGDLIEYLGQKEPWYGEHMAILYLFPNGSRLTHLMYRAHRGASGGEKEGIYSKKQSNGHELWQATPFGWERRAPSLPDVDDVRRQVEKAIQRHLKDRPQPFSLEQFSGDLRPHLSKAIADTRRPYNDVSVWDIGHTGMAFLVTQTIGHILTHRPLEHEALAKTEGQNTLFWRVLSVRTDGLKYLEKASTLADLRVRKSLLEQALERVQHTLEDIPLAIQVYRDENGSFYIFPELEHLSEPIFTDVKSVLRPLAETDDRILDVKLSPTSLVNHPKDEGGKYVGEYIREEFSKELVDRTDPVLIAPAWTEPSRYAEICSACGIRPQGYGAHLVPDYRRNPEYYNDKAKRRNLCCLCMNRRSGVAEQWVSRIEQSVDGGTVWIDEVADDNGRVALIVGQLPIEQLMRSMIYPHADSSSKKKQFHHQVEWIGISPATSCTIPVGRKGQFEWTGTALIGKDALEAFQAPNLEIHDPAKMHVTLQQIELDDNGDILLKVSEDLSRNINIGNAVRIRGSDFSVVDTHELKTATDDAKGKVKNTILWRDDNTTYFFWVRNVEEITVFQTEGEAAKNPSFARIRRIWETTRHFWQEVAPTGEDSDVPLEKSLVGENVEQAGPRLGIRGPLQPKKSDDTPGDYHTYELVLTRGVKMSAVWDPDKKRFTTCDNLEYLAGEGQLGHSVQEALKKRLTLTAEEPVGYGAKNKEWGTITVETVEEIPDTYTPAIPILAEPRTFMTLVPANTALDVVLAIKAKYEREMGKVRNRLPLHLSIVYAHRRTPLRVILDAGRRMLKQKALSPIGEWRVVADVVKQAGPLPEEAKHLADGTQQFDAWYAVKLENQALNRTLTWYVPAGMGDGITEDHWYPYVFLKTDTEPTDRNRHFQAPNPWTGQNGWLVHAGDLKAGDIVYFTAATLDFQWLDSAARRFEIAYHEDGRRRELPRRPYLLDELKTLEYIWGTLKSYLTKNQIYALRDLIEIKREAWSLEEADLRPDGTFRQFCRDALANAGWKAAPWPHGQRGQWLDTWADYAARGWLADVVELHLQIMKEEVAS